MCLSQLLIVSITSMNETGADSCPGNPPPMSSSCMSKPSRRPASKTSLACWIATPKAFASSQPLPTWKLKYTQAGFSLFDALRPSQQFFSHVRMISCLPGFNQHLAEGNVSCSRTQHSASGEPRTHNALTY